MNGSLRKVIWATSAAVMVVVLGLGGGALGARLIPERSTSESIPIGLMYAPQPQEVTGTTTDSGISGDEVSRAFQNRFRSVAASTQLIVVEIDVKNTVTQPVNSSPFNFFFGNPDQSIPKQRQYTQSGLGSGVIVARDGEIYYVLTNNHVAGDAEEIEVILDDEQSYKAELVGADSLMDLALVSFRTTDEFPIAVLGDSDALAVGDWVFAVGNPLGYQSTVTAGIVSAKSRDAKPGSGASGITSFIQTDAAINQGNSGGALVNIDGEVVGINTWIASRNGGNIGLGFAIPINDAKRAVSDFIESGSVSYSWLGVQTGPPIPDLAIDMEIDEVKGAFVFGVYADSPAGKAGILPGDMITKVGEREIADSNVLVRTIAALEAGRSTPMTVLRDGKSLVITVKTENRDDTSGSDVSNLWPGITVVPVTDDVREQLELGKDDDGVVIAGINSESVAGNGGLRQGDLVTEVNGARVRSAGEFYRAIGRDVDEIQFRIVRGGQGLTFGFDKPSA
jgi:Do/DeqQ family serine protease